jgi:hypothetical protein
MIHANEMTELVKTIFLSRSKATSDSEILLWVSDIQDFLQDNDIDDMTARKTLARYRVQGSQYPNLPELCSMLKPSGIEIDMAIIDEVLHCRRDYASLTYTMRTTIDAIGGLGDYRRAETPFQRKEWADKYAAMKKRIEAGYKPEQKVLPVPEAKQIGLTTKLGTPMTHDAIHDRIKQLFGKKSNGIRKVLEDVAMAEAIK